LAIGVPTSKAKGVSTMTQRTKARKGIATKEMEIIAREEGVSPRVVEGQSGLWAANHSGQSEA